MKKIVIFASGTGSNAHKIVQYFEHINTVDVCLIASNKADAGVFSIAEDYGIESLHFDRSTFLNSNAVVDKLLSLKADLIVLAGFLWKIPQNLIDAFPNKIVNIHPALLPKYGGKGMYGKNVHQAVFDDKASETGMTIHYVNEKYDDGLIVFQATCVVKSTDNPEVIAQNVLKLEHQYYSIIIDKLLKNQ